MSINVALFVLSDMCIAKNEGDFVADPYDCSIYYRCVHGATVQLNCAEGLHWSVTLSTCAYPADANCTPMSGMFTEITKYN